MKDRVLIGSLSGMAGATVITIFSIIFRLFGVSSIEMLLLNSSVFLPESASRGLEGVIFGFLINLFIGSIVGIFFIYIFPSIGADYLWYKGILLGAFTWLFVDGFIGRVLELPIKDDVFDHVIFVVLNIVFGIVTVYVCNYLMKRNLIKLR